MKLLEGSTQYIINQNIEILVDAGWSRQEATDEALCKAGKVYITEVTPEFAKNKESSQ